MNRVDFSEDNDVVAWLILGYLCSYPDAKDTAQGVGNWWLKGEGFEVDAEVVRSRKQQTSPAPTITSGSHCSAWGVTAYGLNPNCRWNLQGNMHSHVSLH